MKQEIESRPQAFNRVMNRIRRYLEIDTVQAMQAIAEAKEKELWKEKYSSWSECCEKEFGKSRQRIHQILEGVNTKKEIETSNMFDASDPKNKEILANLNTRQVAALSGLPTVQKAEVLTKAITAEGGKSPKPATIATARRGACQEFSGNGYNGHAASDFYVSRRDEIDPADKMPASTKADVAVARAVSDVYPKTVTFEVLSRAEEDAFLKWSEDILSARGEKNGHVKKPKIDLHGAIQLVCVAYKSVTAKTMSVKGPDASQLRRLLESGITLEEFIATGEKAWKSKNFKEDGIVSYSHQIATFVKHYNTIRNEVDHPHLSIVDRQKEAGGLKGKAYEASVRIVGG